METNIKNAYDNIKYLSYCKNVMELLNIFQAEEIGCHIITVTKDIISKLKFIDYDLSEYSAALISYWKWYTNNQGNNPNSDYWIVQVTNDGENWIYLQNTNESFNFWKYEQFILNEYISLNLMKFRFIK